MDVEVSYEKNISLLKEIEHLSTAQVWVEVTFVIMHVFLWIGNTSILQPAREKKMNWSF